MLITKIEVNGFKSFFGKEKLELAPGINGIVGPNGCGKSNLVDALSWVLGEQNSRLLRIDKMEDIIFGGTSRKKPVGMAHVSLTIDNTDGRLPIEYQELTITRTLFRSGESQFFINKVPCRLRDIKELFLGTGAGRGPLSIINQGQVDQILDTKPAERRAVFEEAAGVSKYRAQREQIDRRLLLVEQNFERISDMLREQNKTLRFLEREAKRAEEYLEVKKERDFYLAAAVLKDARRLFADKAVHDMTTGELTLAGSKYGLQKRIFTLRLGAVDQEINRLESEEKRLFETRTDLKARAADIKNRVLLFSEREKWTEKKTEEVSASIAAASAAARELAKKIEANVEESETIELQIKEKEEQLQEHTDLWAQCDSETLVENAKVKRMQNGYVDLLNRQAEVANGVNSAKKEMEKTAAGRSAIELRLADIRDSRQALSVQTKDYSASCKALEEQLETLRRGQETVKKKIASLRSESEATGLQLKELTDERAVLQSRRVLFADTDAKVQSCSRAVKELFSSHDISGIHGTVGDLLEILPGCRDAVETYLGRKMDYVVIDTTFHARAAVEYLRQNSLGRLTFLPLDTLSNSRLPVQRLAGLGTEIQLASEVVRSPEEYQAVISYLLGTVIIVSDLEAGFEVARRMEYGLTVLTLGGQVILPGGALCGGSPGREERQKDRNPDADNAKEEMELERRIHDLTRSRGEIETSIKSENETEVEIARQITEVLVRLQEVQTSLQFTENQLKQISREHDVMTREAEDASQSLSVLDTELSALETKKENIAGVIDQIQTVIRQKESAVSSFRAQREQKQNHLANLRLELSGLQQGLLYARKDLENNRRRQKETAERLHQQKEEYRSLSSELLAIGEERLRLERDFREIAERESALTAELEKIEQELLVQRECRRGNERIVDGIEERITNVELELRKLKEDDFNFSYRINRVQEQIDAGADTDRFVHGIVGIKSVSPEKLGELQRKLNSMEPASAGAISEYAAACEETGVIEDQIDDMKKAAAHVHKIAKRIEQGIREQFVDFFEKLQSRFEEVYSDLFGGGSARLEMSDLEHPLQSGIEISVQPPGRKMQSLSMLSGGERALTALALLFSVIKENDSPFCILDEVDTSLDDVNIQRFNRFLRECSANTQFTVVTHRQGTMEGADILYGVTMPEEGTSKIISVKLHREVG